MEGELGADLQEGESLAVIVPWKAKGPRAWKHDPIPPWRVFNSTVEVAERGVTLPSTRSMTHRDDSGEATLT